MINTNKDSRGKEQGAALLIALIAALVVMLAATLLISLTERMVNAHADRLAGAQISLSEASAADYLAFLLQENGPQAASPVITHELAGVVTEFTLVSSETADIRSGFFQLEKAENAVVIPTGENLVAASVLDDGTVSVVFFSDETFQPISEFTIETGKRPVAGTGIDMNGETAVILVLLGDGETMICACTPEGVAAQGTFPGSVFQSGSYLSAHMSSTEEPLLVITGGTNTGTLYNVAEGSSVSVSSPGGTCPVFLSNGTLFGSVSGGSPSFSIATIRDVFEGDFNSDGWIDIAFASPFALTTYSGATGDLYRNAPGGGLVCWGEFIGRNGLVGMWRAPDGENWFRFGWNGFLEFVPDPAYRMGWEGRLTGNGSTIAGIMGGTAVVASASGFIRELLTGDVFTGYVDGGDLDFLVTGENGLEVVFNPLSGEGITYVYRSSNSYRGKEYSGSIHLFSMYESNGEIRVFHNLEGVEF